MNYRDYREGKADAYMDALLTISEMRKAYKAEEALERILDRLLQRSAFNNEELERLEKEQ